MRILADENFPGQAVLLLRRRGHDVLWVRTETPGAPDADVLARAQAERRLLVTFDKDFGESAFRYGLPSSSGVVLFRLALRSPDEAASLIAAVLEGRSDWTGQFAVVEEDRVRLRPLPGER